LPEKAYITAEVLKWGRLSAKLSIADVSMKLPCKIEQLESWENGVDYPTVKQAEKLAHLYRRPLAVFYLSKPPKDFQTLRDFRANVPIGDFSTALTFIMREIQEKQYWIKEFLLEHSEKPLTFVGKFNGSNTISEIANDIRNVLEIGQNTNVDDLLIYWINKVEAKRIFVSLASNVHSRLKIDITEARGFVISDNIAPFIFINSDDPETAQLFTLVHELAHIWINQSGVSNIDFREYPPQSFDSSEVFCNEIAAEVLLPETLIRKTFNKTILSFDGVDKFASLMKVSPYFVSVRLLKLDMLSRTSFDSFRKIYNERYEQFLAKKEIAKKKSTGGPDFYVLQIRKNSRAFTHLIYDGYKGGDINGYEASTLLHIKINNFTKLENYLY